MISARRPYSCLVLLLVASLPTLAARPAGAQPVIRQEGQPVVSQKRQPVVVKQEKQPEPLKPRVMLFPLKFANAGDVVQLTGALFEAGRINVAVDERTNSLIVRASDPDVFSAIEDLLKALDRVPDKDQPEIKIFSLRSRQEPSQLNALLGTVVSGSSTAFSIDPVRNLVIAKGDRESLASLEAVLMRLDEADSEEAAGGQILVRVVWLVSGLEKQKATPEDLKEVIDELADIGVTDLSLAAQTVVSTVSSTAGTTFQAEGRATLNAPTELQIEGHVAGRKGENFVVEISIMAEQEIPLPEEAARFGGRGSPRSKNLCRMHTTITAPPRHAVVLGVTPIESMNSVFVIQLLPKKNPTPQPALRR